MSTNLKYYQLLSQIPDSNQFKKTIAAPVFDIGSDFKKDMEIAAKKLADRSLGERGWADERKKNLTRALRDLRDMQKPLDDHSRETKKMSAAAQLPAYDKGSYAARLRRELRDRSCAMTPGMRTALMTGPHRDKDFLAALFEQPAWASGIDLHDLGQRQIYEAAREEHRRDLHGPLMDQVAARDSAEREVRDLAVAVVRGDIQNDSGLEGRDFEEFAKSIESRKNAPWILEDQKTICEVVNGQAVYHLASEDELRDGRQYPGGLPEYLAARAA